MIPRCSRKPRPSQWPLKCFNRFISSCRVIWSHWRRSLLQVSRLRVHQRQLHLVVSRPSQPLHWEFAERSHPGHPLPVADWLPGVHLLLAGQLPTPLFTFRQPPGHFGQKCLQNNIVEMIGVELCATLCDYCFDFFSYIKAPLWFLKLFVKTLLFIVVPETRVYM